MSNDIKSKYIYKNLFITGHNHVKNPNIPGGYSQIDNKTLQWFGATVSTSSKDGGPILVSAISDIEMHNLHFNRQTSAH